QPKRNPDGTPVAPTAQQLDGALAPQTRAAIERAQSQHTAEVDAIRNERPGEPLTDEQQRRIKSAVESYYARNNLYVLPTTGDVFNATVDPVSGGLRLQRPGLNTDVAGTSATETYGFEIDLDGTRREVRDVQRHGSPPPPA